MKGQDPQHDNGFGTCPDCEKEEQARYVSMIDDLIVKIKNALNEQNAAKFVAMSRDKQEFIVLKMLDKGMISWTIGGRHASEHGHL